LYFSVEVRVVAPDGKLHWLNDRGRALTDETGTPVRMIGVAQDISQRKVGEERLRSIVEGTSSTTGADFLRSLVRHLAGALSTQYALISEVVAGDPHRVRLLAFWAGGDYADLFEYDTRADFRVDHCDQIANAGNRRLRSFLRIPCAG